MANPFLRKRDLRVLVVDDDPNLRVVLHDTLRKRGYSIGAAKDGYEAIELLKATSFLPDYDLLMIDVKLPGMDGFQLVRTLREDPKFEIPIVIMSGFLDEDRIKEAGHLRIRTVLVKPLDYDKLMTCLHQIEIEAYKE